jgi:hypothetical protein
MHFRWGGRKRDTGREKRGGEHKSLKANLVKNKPIANFQLGVFAPNSSQVFDAFEMHLDSSVKHRASLRNIPY